MPSHNSVLRHKNGTEVDLPLLIPSFSSKGFAFFTEGRGSSKHIYSETTSALEALGSYLEESFLISAYDLYHEHFRKPERFFRNTSMIFLDSGGYELSPEFDSTEPKLTPVRELDFTEQEHKELLKRLYTKHALLPFVVANFDWTTKQTPYEQQIRSALALAKKLPRWNHNILLKPDTPKGSVIEVTRLEPYISELRDFDVIGVTEKDLGKNLIDRLRRLALLRRALLRHDVSTPIHVWGGLDPVLTPLYFFAGADIFDGVSWLRYVYHSGLSVNRDCYSVLNSELTMSYDQSIHLALNQNLTKLQGLATSLRAFSSTSALDFGVFEDNREILEKAYRTLVARVKEMRDIN